jgi:hypothetical protein
MISSQSEHRFPFGRHKNQPLPEVPSGYLAWAIASCKLSSGLLTALIAELTRRGVEVPPPPARPPIPKCPRCGVDAGVVYRWLEDRQGKKRIRAECRRCRHYLTFAPCISPFIEQADAAASQTPVLDVLIQLEGLGVELVSDGSKAWIASEDYKRVPAELHSLVRQCSHQLARMIGVNL